MKAKPFERIRSAHPLIQDERDAFDALACAVIESAFDDLERPQAVSGKTQRALAKQGAEEFLSGGEGLEFWCSVAQVDSGAIIRGYQQRKYQGRKSKEART